MEVLYRDAKIEKLVTSLPHAKRKLSEQTAVKLFKLITLIKVADNWSDVIVLPRYRFHKLEGKLEGLYSLDIAGVRCSYRLIVSFDDQYSNAEIFQKPQNIEIVQIEEVSNHYE